MERPQPFDRLAYYGRVSSSKQKVEHQRESVLRFVEKEGLNLPADRMFEDKVRRHQAATEGKGMGQILKLAEAGQIDWIIIATFDRWGIRTKDEIFNVRTHLMKHGTRLWSVADDLDMTGDEGEFWRVAAAAEGATRYVSSMAEKNIQKMISMTKGGWAGTGNAPYGTDLVCYPLDKSRPLFRVVKLRYKAPHLYRVITYHPDGTVEKTEDTRTMPPRDKKSTGYRFAPTIETRRLDALKLMFELADQGIGFAEISHALTRLGHEHYDKPFSYHCIETILKNEVYLGTPAWGKQGVGQYRLAMDGQAAKPKRKASEPFVIAKPKSQYVYPDQPLFDPIIDPALFERVQNRMGMRVKAKMPNRRNRSTAKHPLNGIICCPDCDAPMVLGSCVPGETRGGKAAAYKTFVCSTWRKSVRKHCNSNTLRWDVLERATEQLVSNVGDRIDAVTTGNVAALQGEEWLTRTDLGKTLVSIIEDVGFGPGKNDQTSYLGPLAASIFDPATTTIHPDPFQNPSVFAKAIELYRTKHNQDVGPLRAELEEINQALLNIASEIERGIKSPTIRDRLDKRMGELENRKAEIEPKLVGLAEKADVMFTRLAAIRDSIKDEDQAKRAAVMRSFLEKIVPIYDLQKIGTDRRRTKVIGIRFVPKAGHPLAGEDMKIGVSPAGTARRSRRRG